MSSQIPSRTRPSRLLSCVAVLLVSPIAAPGQEQTAPPSPPVAVEPPPSLVEARDLLMTGEYERATAAYEALGKDPGQALEAGLGLARCRLRIGEYNEAIAGLTELNATDSADWHYVLAQALRRVGRYDEVLDHLRQAIQLDKRQAGARLLLGSMLDMLGRRDQAIETYRWFEGQLLRQAQLPRDAEWLTDTAVGFLRYSVLTQTNVVARTKHVLHEMLQMAYERVDRTWWPARLAAADLLRERFNNDPEDGCVADYEAALRINPRLGESHVGLGEVALEDWDFEEAERRAELALEDNPHLAPAIHLLAKRLLRERRYEEAAEVCTRALAINPNDVIALSLRAAAAACQYDHAGVAQMRARVSTLNPQCALFHRALGDALHAIRQFVAAETEYQRAIELDPTDANARTELGVMYMEQGLEDQARDAFDSAWALDPFNARTKFTLDLLDSLQHFARFESEHFIVRYDRERDPLIGEWAGAHLEEIYDQVTGDYETRLERKTIVEVFPTQRTFGVRVTGKPWIHTVGACSGPVIAIASPRRSTNLMGPYDYARVLKHEFTHTVTLAATDYRIPHWFTEGLAVSQEDAPRNFTWSALLADAVRRNTLFTLESIDWGFVRPRRPEDRSLAYAQSEWMCEYIVERFGYDHLVDMLRGYRQKQTTPEVFTRRLGIEPAAFEQDFRKWARNQVTGWGFDLTPPEDVFALRAQAQNETEDAGLFGRLARAELDHADQERALVAARQALQLGENEPNALEVLVTVLAEYLEEDLSASDRRAYEDEALPVLERLRQVDPNGWTAPKHLARIYLNREEWDRALEPLRQLQRLCPMDPASWRGLSGIYLQRDDDDRALPQLLELTRTNVSRADIPAQIARIHQRRGGLREARYWYRQALGIDPFSPKIRQELADTCMQAGDTAAALREFTVLTRLEPTKAGYFENAAYAAHKAGDIAKSQEYARQAVALDPTSNARALLP